MINPFGLIDALIASFLEAADSKRRRRKSKCRWSEMVITVIVAAFGIAVIGLIFYVALFLN